MRRRACLLAALCGLAAATPARATAGDRAVRSGARGAEVRTLQVLLTRAGFPLPADGRYGPATVRAVRAFQSAARLTVTGVASPATVTTLRSAAASAATAPPPTGGVASGAPLPTGATATISRAGRASVPAAAPPAVAALIAAGNRIARLPYRYGGGHARTEDSAYDCSGSVSFALAGAGLLAAPLDSTGLAAWGAAGPGDWVTIYANAEHTFLVVAGVRFDTAGLRSAGSRWQPAARSLDGFTVRHPAGL